MWQDPISLHYAFLPVPSFQSVSVPTSRSLVCQPKNLLVTHFVGMGPPFFQAGVPVELIKMLGDRYSDAVLLYLTVPLSVYWRDLLRALSIC